MGPWVLPCGWNYPKGVDKKMKTHDTKPKWLKHTKMAQSINSPMIPVPGTSLAGRVEQGRMEPEHEPNIQANHSHVSQVQPVSHVSCCHNDPCAKLLRPAATSPRSRSLLVGVAGIRRRLRGDFTEIAERGGRTSEDVAKWHFSISICKAVGPKKKHKQKRNKT